MFHHHAGALYHQLLPYLNKRPLRANLPAESGAGAHWLSPTADGGDGDRCGHRAASLAAIVALQLHVCRLGAPPLQPASRHTAQPENLLLRRARPMLRQMGASGSGSDAGAGAGGVAAMTEAQRLAAAGWQEVHDPSDGVTYYYNTATGASEWEKPKLPPLPSGGGGGGDGPLQCTARASMRTHARGIRLTR